MDLLQELVNEHAHPLSPGEQLVEEAERYNQMIGAGSNAGSAASSLQQGRAKDAAVGCLSYAACRRHAACLRPAASHASHAPSSSGRGDVHGNGAAARNLVPYLDRCMRLSLALSLADAAASVRALAGVLTNCFPAGAAPPPRTPMRPALPAGRRPHCWAGPTTEPAEAHQGVVTPTQPCRGSGGSGRASRPSRRRW